MMLVSFMWLTLAAERPTAVPTPTAEPEALRVVVFGDSLTGHRPGGGHQGQYLKYADLLQLMLEARVGIGRVEMINSGWAGDKTYADPPTQTPGAVARLDRDVIDHEPDIVIVLIGGNDKLADDEARQRTADNLDTIAARLKDAGAKVLMLQYPPAMPNPGAPDKAWDLAKVNGLIAAAAESHVLPVHDLGPAMNAAAEQHSRTDLVDADDGVHLHPRGEMVFARSIFAELDRLGWVPSPAPEQP